ncbi:MAG: DEAD/DEAH box helicase [Chloroflexi bacterium]|nr:DEAD/DEAH box helicase [Chloroflexota bacterium]
MPSASVSARPRSRARKPRHQVTCADCGVSTSVPFRPRGDRPVYCTSCYAGRRGSARADLPSDARNATRRRSEPSVPVRSNDRAAAGKAAVFSEMELSRATRTALAAMEISEPTPIQQETIPLLLAGRDVIGQARTGSGKTLAFATPMVERCDPTVREVQALVLTPTRELAIQVGQVTDAVAKTQGLHTTLLYGGRSARPEQSALRRGHRS